MVHILHIEGVFLHLTRLLTYKVNSKFRLILLLFPHSSYTQGTGTNEAVSFGVILHILPDLVVIRHMWTQNNPPFILPILNKTKHTSASIDVQCVFKMWSSKHCQTKRAKLAAGYMSIITTFACVNTYKCHIHQHHNKRQPSCPSLQLST